MHRVGQSLDDKRRALQKMFAPDRRSSNFGAVLTSLEISGFRGVDDLSVNIESPITALSGLNGTGKSTVAQLACCAYRKLPSEWGRHYVKDYFPVSALDPNPFAEDAKIVYSYSEGKEGSRQVTVTRAKVEWSGYKRQPERSSYYIGLNWFIPKVERRDFSVYAARSLTLGYSRPLSTEAIRSIGKILGLAYNTVDFTEVIHGKKSAQLATATRNMQRYSENHMGFGEGRMIYMVAEIESAPERSLFVLEEPETALHGDAQRRFAQYLIDVCFRRRHQIVLTTHSSAILGELTRDSVVYLGRQSDGTLIATTGLSTYQVDSYLSERHHGRATVCVEDEFAERLCVEIMRACNPHLLTGMNFLRIGGGQEIPNAVGVLRGAGARTVGICDGDMPAKVYSATGMARLPGAEPPEREVFFDAAVIQFFKDDPYKVNLLDLLATVEDHHAFARTIAKATLVDESVVMTEACRAYVLARSVGEFESMVDFVSAELRDRR